MTKEPIKCPTCNTEMTWLPVDKVYICANSFCKDRMIQRMGN